MKTTRRRPLPEDDRTNTVADLLGPVGRPAPPPASPGLAPAPTVAPGVTTKPKRVHVTLRLPPELAASLRDAAVALGGPPHRLTIQAIAVGAVQEKVAELCELHNGGAPFPHYDGTLVGGRQIGR